MCVLSFLSQVKMVNICPAHLKDCLGYNTPPAASILPTMEVVLNVMPNVVPMDDDFCLCHSMRILWPQLFVSLLVLKHFYFRREDTKYM